MTDNIMISIIILISDFKTCRAVSIIQSARRSVGVAVAENITKYEIFVDMKLKKKQNLCTNVMYQNISCLL